MQDGHNIHQHHRQNGDKHPNEIREDKKKFLLKLCQQINSATK